MHTRLTIGNYYPRRRDYEHENSLVVLGNPGPILTLRIFPKDFKISLSP